MLWLTHYYCWLVCLFIFSFIISDRKACSNEYTMYNNMKTKRFFSLFYCKSVAWWDSFSRALLIRHHPRTGGYAFLFPEMKPLRRSIANKTQKSLLEWDGKISLLLKLVFAGFVIWMGSVWVNHIPKPVGSMMDDVDVFEASGFENSDIENSDIENSDIENSDNEYGGSSSIHGELLGLRGAPRTYSGEYNEILPGKKYLVFQSSGGFSNQRGILSQFLELARMLNRTCIVPMITKHTSMWRVAWNVKRKNAFQFDLWWWGLWTQNEPLWFPVAPAFFFFDPPLPPK